MLHELTQVAEAAGRVQKATLRRLDRAAVHFDDAGAGGVSALEKAAEEGRLAHASDPVQANDSGLVAAERFREHFEFGLAPYKGPNTRRESRGRHIAV